MALWAAAAIPLTVAGVLTCAHYLQASRSPGNGSSTAGAETIVWLAVSMISGCVVAGLLHGWVQHRRRAREQQRVRGADQQYLTDPNG
ncbi:hypothetical protein [Streptomyces sp. NPDC088755]|uniref:hypothetical protein n=1 Tax=Streptomyces sp. NPDC088755 TaxID=3365888 RepID=UPI003827B52A